VAEKPESQEICFVPTGDYVQFIEAYRSEQGLSARPDGSRDEGELVTTSGEVLGHHAGVHHFTIGQRRGLGIAAGRPLYVVDIDSSSQRVIVGGEEDLRRTSCEVRDVNWVSCAAPDAAIEAKVKIRYKHEPASATIEPLGTGRVRVRFEEPQRAITPGQAAVFYAGEVLLGGGWISSASES
jgi:tRNA-specific 2-thiouridylase